MRTYHREHYANLPPSTPPSEDDLDNDGDSFSEEDDPNDPDYLPGSPRSDISTSSGGEMAKAMDEMNAFLMQIHGITPQEATKRRKEQAKELELEAQEVSQTKVVEWQNKGVL